MIDLKRKMALKSFLKATYYSRFDGGPILIVTIKWKERCFTLIYYLQAPLFTNILKTVRDMNEDNSELQE